MFRCHFCPISKAHTGTTAEVKNPMIYPRVFVGERSLTSRLYGPRGAST